MALPILANEPARRLFLDRHALIEPPVGPAKGADLLALIRRLGFVQVDSVNTVERAHHMILWSRRQSYRPGNLAPLLERDRTLFEHWTHDASVIPIEFFGHWQVALRPRCRTHPRKLDRLAGRGVPRPDRGGSGPCPRASSAREGSPIPLWAWIRAIKPTSHLVRSWSRSINRSRSPDDCDWRQLTAQLVTAAELEMKDAERRLISEAQTLAVQILAIEQQRVLRQQQTALATKLSEFVAGRAKAGGLSALDAAQAQVDAQRLIVEARKLEGESRSLLGTLKPMHDLDPDTALSISGALPENGCAG